MRLFVLGFATLVAAPILAQQSDLAGILRRVSETYANAKQYRFAMKKTGEEAGAIEIAVQKPNKFRLQADGRVIDGVDEFDNITMVSDGSSAWNYVPEIQQYTKKGVTLPLLDTEPPAITPETFVLQADAVFLSRYAQLAKALDRARLLRQEKLNGVDCYVIELQAPRPGYRDNYTWWVDTKRSLVLREDTAPESPRRPRSSVIYSLASVDEPLAEELFHFAPPAGAKLVNQLEQ